MLALESHSPEQIRGEKRRRAAIRSLSEFVRQAWPLIEPGIPLRWNWHIDAICQHLEAVTDGRIRHLLINIPPGHMKSLLVSVFWPAWVWIRWPEKRGIFSSYAHDLAVRDSLRCRDIIDSPWYQENFVRGEWTVSPEGELAVEEGWSLSEDQNRKDYFSNTKKGFRICTSVGGKGTGFRGDWIVVDDPLNASDAYSKAAREEAIRWWDQTMSSRLNDPAVGAKVIIMQRLHEEDLAGHVLRKGGYDHLCLASEFEPKHAATTSIGWRDPRKEPGELLFPSFFTPAVLAQAKKDLGADAYAGQHGQRPAPPEGIIFKRSWWKRWRKPGDFVPEGTEARLLPAAFDDMLISVDAAFKDTDGSDNVAMGVWGRLGPDRFLIDQACRRMNFTETIHQLLDLINAYPKARTRLIEGKANGPAVISVLKKKVTGLIEIEPEGGKEARAHAVSPDVEAGNVYVPMHAPWVHEYLEELCAFPKAMHDDQVDQTTQALLRFAKGRSGAAATEALAG